MAPLPVLPIGAPSLVPMGWSAPLPAPPTATSGVAHAGAGHPPYATPLPPGPAIPGVGAPPPPVSAWIPPASELAASSLAGDLLAAPAAASAPKAADALGSGVEWTGGALPPLPGLTGLPSWGSSRAEASSTAMMTWASDMERATLDADRERAEGPPALVGPASLGELPPLGMVLGGLGALTPSLPSGPLPAPPMAGGAVAVDLAPAPHLAPPQGSPGPRPAMTAPAMPLTAHALSGLSASGRPSFAEGLEDLFVASPRVPPPTTPAPPPPRLPVSLPPTWVARSPERSRDLAPLALNPDSGTHPTWDDDSTKEEG